MAIRIFDEEEITCIRHYFDELLARTLRDSYSISTARLRYGRVYDIVTDAHIVTRIKDLLGPNVIASGSHLFCKLPGDGKTGLLASGRQFWPLTPSMAALGGSGADLDRLIPNASDRVSSFASSG